MDFITGLPESEGCTNLLVIVDRLTKGIILCPMEDITAEATAWAIINSLIHIHGFPRTIVSDRGTQFVNDMWKRACRLMGITRRLSTAFHPQTDGATERINAMVEEYLRIYVCYDQSNWKRILPMAELALNTRTPASTGLSPFFLAHGYDPSPFELTEELDQLHEGPVRSPLQAGENIAKTLKEAYDWAKAALAYAQQEAERQANRQRSPAPLYKKDDLVWLSLRNIKTDRPSKKLD
jgi:transposase InsO family protein